MSENPSAVDHASYEAERNRKQTLRQQIRKEIDICGRLLVGGSTEDYRLIAIQVAERIAPAIEEISGRSPIAHDGNDNDVDAPALRKVINGTDTVFSNLERGGHHEYRARDDIERALRSVEDIAADDGIVQEEYSAKVDAVGFATKLGVHLQNREMDIGDPLRLFSERSGAVKSLYTGGTGNGKSVCAETEAWDYFQRCDRDIKIIDPAGFRDGENWFGDVPLMDEGLRERRAEFDLPETLADIEGERPDIQILVPLTPEIANQELPYDVDDDQFVVEPFTIPAADIRQSLLVSILTAKLTDQQEGVIRDAYQEVDHRSTDWSLRDLADEIQHRDELKPSKRKPAIRTLRQLQNRGFVRTRSSEYAIDWREIFESTDTYTVFSQSFLDSTIAKLIVFGYIANTIATKRQDMHNIPEAVVVMRELWKIAPHNRRQEFDERAAQLQEAIGLMLSRLFRDNRHSAVHVLADTQQPSDLLKPVREMFNRYVVFQTNKRITKDIFEWTSNDNWKSFYDTLTPKPGEASVVGMVEPAVEERNIQFVGPVRYAPPPHHHKTENTDSTGWHARAKYFSPIEACDECGSPAIDRSDDGWTVECQECGESTTDYSGGHREELRRPVEMGVDWPFEVPTRLLIESDSAGDDQPDPATDPVAVFVDRCVDYDASAAIQRERFRETFNAWLVDHDETGRDEPWDFDDHGTVSRFGNLLTESVDGDVGRGTVNGEVSYKNLTLTETGRRFAPPKKPTRGEPDAS